MFSGIDPASPILEVACGSDYLFDSMPASTKEMFGKSWIHTDGNKELIESNKRRHPERDYKVQDMRALTEPDGSVDLLVSLSGLDCIGYNHLEDALREFSKVLKNGGKFVHILDWLGNPQFYRSFRNTRPEIFIHGAQEIPTDDDDDPLFKGRIEFGDFILPKASYQRFFRLLNEEGKRLIKSSMDYNFEDPQIRITESMLKIGELVKKTITSSEYFWLPWHNSFNNILREKGKKFFSSCNTHLVWGQYLGPPQPFQQERFVYVMRRGILSTAEMQPHQHVQLQDGSKVQTDGNVLERMELVIFVGEK